MHTAINMGFLYAKQKSTRQTHHIQVNKYSYFLVFPLLLWDYLMIKKYVVLKPFFRGDIQKQWLLVEMVSLSGSGGRWEVMTKLLSFILLPCPHFALKVKKKNIQSVRLKGDSTLSFSCCATLVKIQTNAFRIFIPGKKNIWLKSKFYTRISHTWKKEYLVEI